MEEYLDRLKGLHNELTSIPGNPTDMWGPELTIALMAFHMMVTGKQFSLESTGSMIWFELGRRYERKWPQEQTIDLPESITANLPGLGTPKTPQELIAILEGREKFAANYGKEHGWDEDPGKWNIKQILEVREQPGWKEPKI